MTVNQDLCERRADVCYQIAGKHYGKEFKRIPIEYSNRMTKTAGKFTFNGFGAVRIRLSNKILDLNACEFIGRTVGHEIAHHIVHMVYGRNVQPHGREWARVMELFGQEASRCHSMETVQAKKFKYVVDGEICRLGKIQHGRCQRGQTYIARVSKAKITADKWVGE